MLWITITKTSRLSISTKEVKLTNDVRVFINEEFFKPRGIENLDVSCRFGFKSPSELPNEWSEYNVLIP